MGLGFLTTEDTEGRCGICGGGIVFWKRKIGWVGWVLLGGLAGGQVDGEGVAFGLGVGFGGDGAKAESGLGEAVFESGVFGGGPDRGASAEFEGVGDSADSAAGVEAGVGRLQHGLRAVVDVEDNGVVGFGAGAVDDWENIVGDHGDAGIVEEFAVEVVEKLAVPFDDFGEEFGDVDLGGWAEAFECAQEREAETESADEDARGIVFGKTGAGDFAEEELGGGGAGVHDVLAVEADAVISVVFVEGEEGVVGSPDFGEFAVRFHGGKVGAGGGREQSWNRNERRHF